MPRRMLSYEMPDEQPDVLATLREGRGASFEHRQPMKEVETKTPLGDEGREIHLGCGDHADIQSYFSIRATGLYPALLKYSLRSLPCSVGSRSAISSRNSTPRSAERKKPRWSSVAPVNDPRRWPNN